MRSNHLNNNKKILTPLYCVLKKIMTAGDVRLIVFIFVLIFARHLLDSEKSLSDCLYSNDYVMTKITRSKVEYFIQKSFVPCHFTEVKMIAFQR